MVGWIQTYVPILFDQYKRQKNCTDIKYHKKNRTKLLSHLLYIVISLIFQYCCLRKVVFRVRSSKESPDLLLALSEKFHLLCFCLRQVCSQIFEEKTGLSYLDVHPTYDP